jgi:cell division protease FtsH
MVTKYGFSDKLGLVNYSEADEVFLGKDFTTHKNYSEEIASEIDEEIKAIIDEAFATAIRILTENKDKLELVAQALLEIETLDGEQFEALYSGEMSLDDLKKQIHDEAKDIAKKNEAEAAETELLLKEAELAEAADSDFYEGEYDDEGNLLPDEDGWVGERKAPPRDVVDRPGADASGGDAAAPRPEPKPKPKKTTVKKTVKKAPKRIDKEGKEDDE